ncbi:crotonase/enoyl-CoA hydratase family protein [Sphingopyxis sp. GW247-27LB]|uniref:crotonase/enoyl-CoA hydratase family protein n=1 Tax=Sphingopyxis sp. GW247-27LB TaxID=2012632 RepID=UPI000BA6A82A|nr:crotonase/enoyl-CoA hydratase family protein [Sphingopyxis sp. GW247-27LB]PAL22785.1 enoyl-CoA hydratase [Sphingopyxis sp. GW247-27LB]
MTDTAVLTERQGHILIVTINRPEARNAVNAAVHAGIGTALEQAEHDPEIRVVIVTGAGDKSFCAGADLVALSRGESLAPDDPAQQAWGFGGFAAHPISKPVIGAVNGFAFGGGCELALMCDLVVAADHAQFALPEVKVGLFAAAGGAFRLAQQLPRKLAMEYMLTGDPIPAPRAAAFGLVNHVVPLADLMPAAIALAEKIAANAPLSVQASKRVALGIDEGRIAADAPYWEHNTRERAVLMRSEDAREGPRAFAEKRKPVWKAR